MSCVEDLLLPWNVHSNPLLSDNVTEHLYCSNTSYFVEVLDISEGDKITRSWIKLLRSKDFCSCVSQQHSRADLSTRISAIHCLVLYYMCMYSKQPLFRNNNHFRCSAFDLWWSTTQTAERILSHVLNSCSIPVNIPLCQQLEMAK